MGEIPKADESGDLGQDPRNLTGESPLGLPGHADSPCPDLLTTCHVGVPAPHKHYCVRERGHDEVFVPLLPEEPLPPYTFVPGQAPHPESDPAGHSFGHSRGPASFNADDWHHCRVYLRGIDLFNAGFLWESHVEFESLWLACGRRGTTADYFKAWVKLAAAGVKHREGMGDGVKSHAARAAELLRSVVESHGNSSFLGFDLAELIRFADTIHQAGWPARSPVVLPRMPDETC